MIYKYGENYDDIQHSGADLEFIEQIFATCKGDSEKAKAQLTAIYGLEYRDNLQKSVTPNEKIIAQIMLRRNTNMVERKFLELELQNISSRATPMLDGSSILSSEDAINYAETKFDYATLNVNIHKDDVGLLAYASNVSDGIIFGKQRDTFSYQQVLEDKRNPEKNGINQMLFEIELAQEKYNAACSFAQETVGGKNR